MDPLQVALNKAKISLMSRPDSAFFTTVCFSLKHVWDNTCRSAATDGESIFFNPDFFMGLDQEERVFLLLHESMHVAFLHMNRLKERDKAKWNVACDHVINLMLLERKFKMPSMGLADRAYTGMSAEQVYAVLPAQNEKEVDQDIRESGIGSDALQRSVEDILIRAAIQSKVQGDAEGTIPQEIQIFLNRLLSPKLPWQRILQKYLNNLTKNDFTFRKPNRRFFPEHYLPSLHSERLMSIAIAVDASGSVSDEEFLVFVSEIHSILKMMKPEKITLIQFTTRITSVDEIKSVRELSKVRFVGRGGTRIGPVIEWANENKPQLLLTFTDGAFRFFGEKTKSPTIWLINNNPDFEAPYGKVIHYEIER